MWPVERMGDDPLSPPVDEAIPLDTYALSSCVYAERADGRILLLKRAAGSAMAGQYFLPGGVVDPGEDPWAAAARELREEAGLELSGPLAMVGCYPMFIYGREFLQLTFRGAVAGDVAISAEHTDHRWVDPGDWAALFTDDVIEQLADGRSDVERLLRGIGDDARRYLEMVRFG